MPGVPRSAFKASEKLRDAYRTVWERIISEQQAILNNPRKGTRMARLKELQRTVENNMTQLDAKAETWVRTKLAGIYRQGGLEAAKAVGQDFTWSLVHKEAFNRHAQDLYADLLKSTRYVRVDTKRWIREAARIQSMMATTTDTAQRAAQTLVRQLEERGIAAITYADGSRHGLSEYAEMAIRTKTAVAYNDGTITQGTEAGTEYFEVFDGPECGWTEHDDDQLALGMIVTADMADEYPISHPNCRRGFGPRPDILTPEDAIAAQGGQVTSSQTAAQVAADAVA